MRYGHLRGLGETPVQPPAPPEFAEQYGEYVLTVALAGGGSSMDTPVQIDPDADFKLLGIKGSSTGTYTIRLRDNSGRPVHSAMVNNVNAVGTAQFPVPMVPGPEFPAAGRIRVDLTDTSGAANTVQLCFIGVRKYRVAG